MFQPVATLLLDCAQVRLFSLEVCQRLLIYTVWDFFFCICLIIFTRLLMFLFVDVGHNPDKTSSNLRLHPKLPLTSYLSSPSPYAFLLFIHSSGSISISGRLISVIWDRKATL